MECLNEMLSRTVRLLGDRPFIIADDETLTYAEFDRRAARLANVFASLGVKKGDPVGLYLPSSALLAAGYWACQKLGAIPAPMSVMFRDTEIGGIVARTGMRVIVTNAATFEFAAMVRARTPSLEHVLVAGARPDGALPLEDAMRAAADHVENVPCLPGDTACLFFTSGTTGQPKGAMQSQLSQHSTLRDMFVYNRFRWASEVFMDALPLFNNFGATCKMNLCIYSGGTMVLHERWDTQRVLHAIRTHRVTFIAGTPTMFVYLCNEFDPARDDLSSLRLAVTGGAPVPVEVMAQFEASFGVRLVQIYGATETTGYNTGEPLIGVRKLGSAGVPIGSSSITIVDDDGRALPAGERGEVLIGGDCVGKGYWHDADASAKAFTAGGWLSGDIGYVDDDGYLFIVDRKKDLIISGGYNIYPLEVENLLYKHPSVAVCALVGEADAVKGEIPVAVVVPKPGVEPGAAAGAELIEYCRRHVAAYKAPRRVYFIEQMPQGPSGKILKREIRARIADRTIAPAA
ncbi:MAG: AMP-binding protein [Burkholderiaceae bacterium]